MPTLDDELEHFHRAARPTLAAIGRAAAGTSKELRPLVETIRRQLFEPDFDVGKLKRELGLRDKRLLILFHRETGLPPGRYIQHARMDTAARLLRSTSLTLDAIASLVGYSEPRAFRRAFRQWSALGPKRYREVTALVGDINEMVAPHRRKVAGQDASLPSEDDDSYLGWTVTTTMRQTAKRRYVFETDAEARRFADRIVQIAGTPHPHRIRIEIEDGVLSMEVESASTAALTPEQDELVEAVDACYREPPKRNSGSCAH